jgi:NADPH:quinone reductase-like Zn-dependent oxidoreductase
MSKETPMLNPSAVLYGPHDVRIEDRPVPKPAPGQVLVEIAAVGICGSDVHYYEHGRIGDYVVRDPMIIGHESAGTVVDLGDGVDEGREVEIDSRPSDAIALAVRAEAPIYANERVIEESAIEFEGEEVNEEEIVDEFRKFLDDVSPDQFAVEEDDGETR